jgi:hypothetical protein
MKRKDIALIAVVAIFAAIVSLLLTQTIFVAKKDRELTAEIVDPITSEFSLPSNTYFNKDSINPTQIIRIGDGTSSNPF